MQKFLEGSSILDNLQGPTNASANQNFNSNSIHQKLTLMKDLFHISLRQRWFKHQLLLLLPQTLVTISKKNYFDMGLHF